MQIVWLCPRNHSYGILYVLTPSIIQGTITRAGDRTPHTQYLIQLLKIFVKPSPQAQDSNITFFQEIIHYKVFPIAQEDDLRL